MASQSSGVPIIEKSEVHTETLGQAQPIDLAHRGSAVVQIRPVRSISGIAHGPLTGKQVGSGGTAVATISAVTGAPASIISMNRAGSGPNLTILPARGTCQPGGTPAQIPAYLARGTIVGNVRTTGHTPASITVTPISSSNFGTTGIRLAAPVNNGTWATVQPTNRAQVPMPVRATTISVTRAVRSEAKMIHIGNPPGGTVQHTQLALVDNKGSVLKPQITTTPIAMNVRGNLQGGASTTPLTLPIAPFTIRANIANLPIQQRGQSPGSGANSQAKVITQPAHGPPIQLVSTQKLPIHAISQSLPRLNTVCLTLSTHGPISSNNTAPVVAVASRQGSTNLNITQSASGQASSGGALPVTKVYPVNRDGNAEVDPLTWNSVVETLIATQQAPGSSASVNAIPFSTQGASASQPSVVIASSTTSNSQLVTQGPNASHHHGHHLVQVHGVNVSSGNGTPVGVGIMGQQTVSPSSISQSYYHVDPKSLNNFVQQHHGRPVTIEKRAVVSGEANKGLLPGSTVILTTQNQPPNHQAVTIPLTHNVLSHPISVSHQQQPHNSILQSHQVLNPSSSSVSGGASVVNHSQSSGVQIGHHSIPTHVISQPVTVTSSASVSVTPVTTANVTMSQSMIVTTSHSSSSTTLISTSNANSAAGVTITSSSNSMQTSTPAQSPSQAKSTLSPRPSILRKQREAGDHNHHIVTSRAQRNLALNFAINPSAQVASASAAAAAAAAANKENSAVNTISLGSIPSQITVTPSVVPATMSILKKEFQPPNEESSWQSCSSNSSSGSTTISTTSETAEIQMQQQQSQSLVSSGERLSIPVSLGLSLPGISLSSPGSFGSGACSSNAAVTHPASQNGVVRSGSSNIGRGKGSKSNVKEFERSKVRLDKDDGVSPRKKPRKQQLTTSDLFESGSPEISFYQGKRFRKSDLMDPKTFDEFSERFSDRFTDETASEATSTPKIVYYLKKPQMSLLQSNKYSSKPPQNHFQRYCDVKSKDERRPTVNDLLNQKNVIQKCNGWKLQHLNNQVEEIIELEGDVVDRFTALLNKLEAKVGPNCADKDLNRIQELLKGNIQRGKVIRDQMLESKSQVHKILEHKPRVLDVINRYNSKRPIKKRERL